MKWSPEAVRAFDSFIGGVIVGGFAVALLFTACFPRNSKEVAWEQLQSAQKNYLEVK